MTTTSHTSSSIADQAIDLIPQLSAATGKDFGTTLAQFSQYAFELSTASEAEKIYATSALKEAWSQLNLDKVTDHQVPEIVKVWARRKPQEGEVIRAQVKSAISKAKETLESFKGSSISDGRLRDGLSDLVNKFCFDALSDCNNTAPATNYVSHFFFFLY